LSYCFLAGSFCVLQAAKQLLAAHVETGRVSNSLISPPHMLFKGFDVTFHLQFFIDHFLRADQQAKQFASYDII